MSGVTIKAAGTCAQAASLKQVDQTSEELPASCLQSCECPKWLQWQCGSDGRTYGNPCLAQCGRSVCPEYFPPGGLTTRPGGRCPSRDAKYVVMEQVYLNQYYYTAFNKK